MNLIRPRKRVTPVAREDNGKLSGYLTEHWNDRIDALVLSPEALIIKPKLTIGLGQEEIIRKVNEQNGRR